MVRTAGLGKRFGSTWALRDLDLQIEPGEVFGYLGPNGAGKTTTLRLLLGLLRPSTGSAVVCGHDAWSEPVAVHRKVGYLSGEGGTYPRLTGQQHLDHLGALRGVPSQRRAHELAERFDLDLGRQAAELSRGNRQKLALVLAMMAPTELLVLDEPTSGLDPLAQQEFHLCVREQADAGGAVLLSSHVLAEVQRMADRVGVLREGRLVAVEGLDALRARSMHHVRATLDAPPQAVDFGALPGVRDLVVKGCEISCNAPESALDGLVKALALYPVRDLTCTEAELEEAFLGFYTGGDHDAD
ncbi:ABC transporter ATP-binding protein [Pedococcus sp. KACC 23699]|uniref:ABC transporter ATP-binding protein n=1 Tax=Pedococcus sp. KACC 23699 TaxID=3149228 RepID=A0AAU7JWW7_9MICO